DPVSRSAPSRRCLRGGAGTCCKLCTARHSLGNAQYYRRDERSDAMSPAHRPLSGCMVNLSISESNDSATRGFPSWQVNRVTLQFVAALFGQGASVVFGHDWREDGVMEAGYGFARQAQPPVPLSARSTAGEAQPILHNLLPWPDSPYLPERDMERLSATL